jgi:hypothetical protein
MQIRDKIHKGPLKYCHCPKCVERRGKPPDKPKRDRERRDYGEE